MVKENEKVDGRLTKMFKQKVSLWMMIVAVAITGVMVGRLSIENVRAEGSPYEELKTFTEVLSLVKKNYVEEIKDKDMIYGAIKGMLNTLDPHSSFMPPDIFKEMQIETKGEFAGLGIQIGIKDSVLTVIAPIEDTPAYKIGIKAGDKILKIDGESTKGIGLYDAVTKLRGLKGTSVTISVIRKGWKETKDFTIVRDIIKIQSVKSNVIEDGIGYIKLLQFKEQTAADLKDALKKLDEEKINSLILDLRNNPGGLLNSSVDVSSQFLPSKKLVVYIKGREGKRIEYFTGNDRQKYDYPMVVLVNEGSASASEIVAGALKDWGRAVILGTKTFGKGSVQTVIPLSDGSGLRLTTAIYYTPKGESIQTTGITPDIIVEPVIKKEIATHPVIREQDLERHLENNQVGDKDKDKDKETEEVPVKVSKEDDIQLQRAIDLLKTWRVFKELPKAS